MKKRSIYFFSIVLILIGFLSYISASPVIDKTVIEKLESKDQVESIITINNSNLEIKKDIIDKFDDKNILHNNEPDSLSVELTKSDLEKLKKEDAIIEINYAWPFKIFLQDSVSIINASASWNLQDSGINLTGVSQTVCVLDTGINFSHHDLIGKNLTCNIDCYNKDCIENCSVTDEHGHGTHIAGIIGANGNIMGIAKNVNLIAVKVLNTQGEGSSDDIVAGIDWCIENSPRYNISVISMSLGCNETADGYNSYCDTETLSNCGRKEFTQRINNATFYNISVVVAAGNSGWTNGISAPACIRNATAVSATAKNDEISSFSNRNNITFLLAPGQTINSTNKDGQYTTMSGTSMSAPMVAGAIAILKQFLKSSNQFRSSIQIKSILYNSGQNIIEGNNTFSRIDIYNSILSVDNIAPNIILDSPVDNHKNATKNQTFICNCSDWQLSNTTFYLWNSSSGYLINNQTKNLSDSSDSAIFNVSNLNPGNYEWNCLAYDTKGNSNFSINNFSLNIKNINLNLIAPSNFNYTNKNQTNFTCQVQTEETYDLKNITFYLWNSSGFLIINETKNISGFFNSTNFNYTFFNEGNYEWNCLGFNGILNSTYSDFNFSISYDITNPNIDLNSPEDYYSTTENEINFNFNASDNSNLRFCSIILTGDTNYTQLNQSQILLNQANFINISSIDPGSYSWHVNCIDLAGNELESNSRNFSINRITISSDTSSSGGGGGSGISVIKKNTLNQSTNNSLPIIENLKENVSYKKSFKELESWKFNIYNNNYHEEHNLVINKIGDNYAEMTIFSNPINFRLYLNQEKKLNLTSENYLDLSVTLTKIENNYSEFIIKNIYEPININNISELNNYSLSFDNPPTVYEKKISLEFVFIALILVFFFILLILELLKRMHKAKIKKKITSKV
ncbi:MAG: S8 family peptidase [Nanoarchaeota archaeon]